MIVEVVLRPLSPTTSTAFDRSFERGGSTMGKAGKDGSSSTGQAFHDWMFSRFGTDLERLDVKKKGLCSNFDEEFVQTKYDFAYLTNVKLGYETCLVVK
jgi:hypothetical protein